MSVHIKEILNCVNIEDYRYLELGTNDNINFSGINAKYKVGVDINGTSTFTGTTDEFFTVNKDEFDIVFVDADHRIESVVKDYNNSIKICKNIIFLHDMVPPEERCCSNELCSDSYKILYHLHKLGVTFKTLNCDFGLTYIEQKDFVSINLSEIENISYNDFITFLKSNIELVTVDSMIESLRYYFDK